MTEASRYEVAIVGAGAAGLMAAIHSAERGRHTLLLEKNRRPGVKILMSGGTRCNITHDCDAVGVIAAFGSAGCFLHSPLAALGTREVIDLFEEEGLATKIEPGGKVFPQSDRALDVLNALLSRLRRSGAELCLGDAVLGIKCSVGNFEVETQNGTVHCNKLIVTTGGRSYPGCGTVGDGYQWLASLGHTIRRPRPALVPLTSDEAWVRELSGVTIPDVVLSVVDSKPVNTRKKRRRGVLPLGVLIERRGSMLFTHFGLSGPVVLDVSRAVTGTRDPRGLILRADFLPNLAVDVLDERLRHVAAIDGKKQVATVFGDELPRRLIEALLQLAAVPVERRTAELSKTERSQFLEQLKQCKIHVTGSRGFEKAEVTAGGVALNEVDSRTMESKLVPGLFLAGEILDLDGFIGGYNFQAAFSTGWLAGASV